MTERVERRLAAILSADVAGYTRLMHADEEGTLNRLLELRTDLIEPKIADYSGRVVKLMGDGLLVEFASVVNAVRCASEWQRSITARNADVPAEKRIVFRIGINLGDVIVTGDDLYGDGINVANRMQEIAPPGGIAVSGVVYDSVRDKLEPGFADLGPQQVKNIAEPVRAYRVLLEPDAADAASTPEAQSAPEAVPRAARAAQLRAETRLTSIMSGIQRRGDWRVARKLNVLTVMGGIDLDFRHALLEPGITDVQVTAVMGGVAIVVPPDLPVVCNGTAIMGNFEGMDRRTAERDPAAPVLRITGLAVMGAVEIETRDPGDRLKEDAGAFVGQVGRR